MVGYETERVVLAVRPRSGFVVGCLFLRCPGTFNVARRRRSAPRQSMKNTPSLAGSRLLETKRNGVLRRVPLRGDFQCVVVVLVMLSCWPLFRGVDTPRFYVADLCDAGQRGGNRGEVSHRDVGAAHVRVSQGGVAQGVGATSQVRQRSDRHCACVCVLWSCYFVGAASSAAGFYDCIRGSIQMLRGAVSRLL